MLAGRPDVAAILPEDHMAVAEFLHTHLNRRVPVDAWLGLLNPTWDGIGDSGCVLRVDGEVVGAYVVVNSRRRLGDGPPRDVCNLAAFCVREDHRAHSLRLVRHALARKDIVYTDLSPSGNVPSMNERLGFHYLDTRTRLVLNTPMGARGVRVTDDPATIASLLSGHDAQVYTDHRGAPAARHLVAVRDGRHAYLLYRRDTRKRLRVFASPLYVGGDPGMIAEVWPAIGAHLLRQGLVGTLAEYRVLGFAPTGVGIDLPSTRRKMYRAVNVEAHDIDYLYSELVLLEW